MRTANLFRVAAVSLALAAPVAAASVAHAQDQAVRFTDNTGVTHYGYFSKGDQIRAGLEPSIQQSGSALARGPSTVATDAGDAAIANDPSAAANPHLYNPEAFLNQEGSNAW